MPPSLYESLKNSNLYPENKLNPESAKKMNIEKILVDEKNFRWLMNENEVATEKLSEGIRLFSQGNIYIIYDLFKFFLILIWKLFFFYFYFIFFLFSYWIFNLIFILDTKKLEKIVKERILNSY
jgi:hypothetical protein